MNDTNEKNWQALIERESFKKLLAKKKAFILPACLFFVIYYFSLLYMVGWHADLMKKTMLGKVNLAYLFALSQFFMAWTIAWLYTRKAAEFDKLSDEFLTQENLTK